MNDEKIVIRPSSIRSFMETGDLWWKRHIENTDDFNGNTKTYLGTVVHAFAETYYTMGEFNPHAILENAPEEVDKTFVLANYKGMCDALEDKYLSKQAKPELLEHFMKKDLDNDFVLQGTCDFYNDGVLGDYKTSAKPVKKIDDYLNQLHIYAYLLSLTDREVHTYRIVNIVAKTKTIPARVNVLEAPADIEKGKELVTLMHLKAKLAYDNPDYKKVIFHSNTYSFLDNSVKVETSFSEL